MTNYILRRLFQAVLMFFILTFLCYALMSLMPGDPIELLAQSNPNIRPEDLHRLRALYGLDLPIWQRYFNWLSDVFHGELGYSRTYHVPVMDLLGERFWNTALLSITSLIISLSIALPLGVRAALKHNTSEDYIINGVSFAARSLPAFWVAIMCILIFAVKLKWLPASGTASVEGVTGGVWGTIVDRAKYLALPVLVFSVTNVSFYLRYIRASLLETLKMDYVRTARAKGLSGNRVLVAHAFRNALIPVVTVLGINMSGLFDGAAISESIFSYRGVGSAVLGAILGSDYNLAMVSFSVTIAMTLTMSLLVDLLYAWLDPRITLE